jgi:hypothetical protein
MNPIIVAPLLRKPIVEDAAIRSAWGLAPMKFESASRVVAIGFSAARLRTFTPLGSCDQLSETREGVEVVVMNPSNGENSSDYEEFKKRMNSIFLRGNSAPFGRCRASLGWTVEGGCP